MNRLVDVNGGGAAPGARPLGPAAAGGAAVALGAEPFALLTPDCILEAIDAALGLEEEAARRTSGQVLALNSYENRVFQVGIEGRDGAAPPLVAKFYRPGRWSEAQILEEHAFAAELVEAEVPAVAPLVCAGRSLHEYGGFRFALFEKRGGRTPELGDAAVRARLGRFLGRLHLVGARRPYLTRSAINVATFAEEPSAWLLEHGWLPSDIVAAYRAAVGQAIEGVRAAFAEVEGVGVQRVHGDCHPGNLLWTETGPHPGPHFVDFDDSASAPPVQDLWMLLSGDRAEASAQLRDVVRGYEQFAEFDRRGLRLIEPLRTLRLIHYAAWIARRWSDPAFPAAFPWFLETRFWEARVLELREQIGAMQEPLLEI